ncbi:cytochrome c biogenesis protein ResB [Aeromicrobium sp. CF3.5]|uniref:cytochrome c biogenesis protein ResB n=1 Tax=Aeromicrobium sp. CF3.5 TaxID=3373078 RepID=UPI003EE73EB1
MSSTTNERDTAREPAPPLNTVAFARWIWRQLTSMRTALSLLLLLAIAAVPGSLVPQRGVDARAVEAYLADHPTSGPILDSLGMFSVYTSPWFSGIYLLLMVSLVGCIVPRTQVYAKALRARPPKVPRRLERLPASSSFETSSDVDDVIAAARQALGRARVDVVERDGSHELSAEKGYLREAGNLVFHISIVVVLVGVAASALLGYRGAAIVTEGDRFSNVLTQYDEFTSGALFDREELPPFSLQLDDFAAKFQVDGPQRGAPRSFEATGSVSRGVDGADEPYSIRVNHPLNVDGSSVYLVGQGYAPVIRVTDPDGTVVFDEAVPFLPADPSYTSNGVVKVSEAEPEQLGLQGFFLPTFVVGDTGATRSAFPDALQPILGLFVWHGDLGLDEGVPQSVYVLDKTNMEQYMTGDKGYRVSLQPGQSQVLPDGNTIEFVDLRQFARFQIASAPFVQVPLFGISIGVLGLIASLAVKPRRTWIRIRREGSRTVVTVAVLDRVPRVDLPADLDRFMERFRSRLGDVTPAHDDEKAT